jgi:signal transduction histidine kinase/ligand-binding sensor domain-containing protein/ActR/RegA family two-component response regulator
VVLVLGLLLFSVGMNATAAMMTLPETPHLRQFGTADGLPSRSVVGLAQDQTGYLWLATDDGLARYDGVSFRVWHQVLDDPSSLPSNYLEVIHIDPRDRIWVGSNGGGLSMMDVDRKGFQHFPQLQEHCEGLVWALASTDKDDLWIGTSDGGVCRMDAQGRIGSYKVQADDENSLPDNAVLAMMVDRQGGLWVGTDNGLARWNKTAERFERVAQEVFGGQSVVRLSQEPDGTLWVGTQRRLYRMGASGTPEAAPWSLKNDGVYGSVLRDRMGTQWIATTRGLYLVNSGKARLLEGDTGSGFLTDGSVVYRMLEDHEGGLWFGTLTQGLAYLPPNWRRFSVYSRLQGKSLEDASLRNAAAVGDKFLIAGKSSILSLDPHGEGLRVVTEAETLARLDIPRLFSILPHSQGSYWLGGFNRLSLYDPILHTVRHWPIADKFGATDNVDLMLEAPDGTLWLSVLSVRLQHRTRDGELIEDVEIDNGGGPVAVTVEQLAITPEERLWVATSRGMFQWNGTSFEPVPGAPQDKVFDFAFSGGDSVWLARVGAIERYDWDGMTLTFRERIDQRQGMPLVNLSGLVVGGNGNVWVVTMTRGLILYQPQVGRLRVYGQGDGLPDAEFSALPPRYNPELGVAIALSYGGVVLFDPDMRPAEAPVPKLTIAAIHVRRGRSGIDENLTSSDSIHLRPGDRDLRVTARLLSYANPALNRYRFRVPGYDSDWIDQGHQGERVFAGIPPGDYRVEVQAACAEGRWSDIQYIDIHISPPWWRSDWGIALFVLMGLLLLVVVALYYRAWLRRRHAWQLALHKRELAEQASLAKTRFLATLGHEVRTPMTGVLGMSELLLDTRLNDRQRQYTESIRSAGQHLLRLVNDALDLARIESGRLELDLQDFDVYALVKEAAELMRPIAMQKGLDFRFSVEPDTPGWLHGDVHRIRQILLNLLSNAVKFTEHGYVGLQVTPLLPKGVHFTVSDSGPGLSEEQKLRLFRRFEQGDGARTAARYGGSGLGLAVCQELALAMHGCIEVLSTPGLGTSFLVDLPLDEGEERQESPDAVVEVEPKDGKMLDLLLVEDDPMVAEVMVGMLTSLGHRVTHVLHGLAALGEITDKRYDMALLDLDLPGIDGFSLVRQLRAMGFDGPAMAVTARADADLEMQVSAAGFETFLRKPVTIALLAAAIEAAYRAHADGSMDGMEQG